MGLRKAWARWRGRSPRAPAQPGTPASDAPALYFDRFELLRPLGRGAYSEVFLSLDIRSGQRCALKIMSPSPGGGRHAQEAHARFAREAHTRLKLAHPDIQRVLDAGQSGTQAWIALEWVDGCELSRYTHPARLLPPALVARIGARIAEALHYAHARGVVHRDLKPDNVLVDVASDVVKVTDFGVARLDDAEATRTGVVLGSPAYMAPELLAGSVADARGDVYALGVLLFQLLSGRLPFDAPTMGELLQRVAKAPAPDLLALQPGLPPPLAQAVARALSKDPTRRQADAGELARELRHGATFATSPPGSPP